MGLREDIKNAQSDKEINDLLLKGNSYEWASLKTKLSWKSTAKQRLSVLNTSSTQVSSEIKEVKKSKTKTLKKSKS